MEKQTKKQKQSKLKLKKRKNGEPLESTPVQTAPPENLPTDDLSTMPQSEDVSCSSSRSAKTPKITKKKKEPKHETRPSIGHLFFSTSCMKDLQKNPKLNFPEMCFNELVRKTYQKEPLPYIIFLHTRTQAPIYDHLHILVPLQLRNKNCEVFRKIISVTISFSLLNNVF